MPSKICLFISFCCFGLGSCAQSIPNLEDQINAAVLAAPEEMRAASTVLGYDAGGKLISLRVGDRQFNLYYR